MGSFQQEHTEQVFNMISKAEKLAADCDAQREKLEEVMLLWDCTSHAGLRSKQPQMLNLRRWRNIRISRCVHSHVADIER